MVSQLQGMFFVPIKDTGIDLKVKDENIDDNVDQPVVGKRKREEVGVVLLFRDHGEFELRTVPILSEADGSTDPCSVEAGTKEMRSRLELCSFEKREIEVAEGFKDINNANGGEPISRYDWVCLPLLNDIQCTDDNQVVHPHWRGTSISPLGTLITALHLLPAVPPHNLALAVIASLDDAFALSHISLGPTRSSNESVDSTAWSALIGQRVNLPLRVHPSCGFTVSQGVERGSLGLLGMLGCDNNVDLLICPDLNGMSQAINDIRKC